ncbi:MAG: DnaD domain protein, partial [Eubacteriales bacterium]|nr:DnaD domain protein [Eubacteriales bacterium]
SEGLTTPDAVDQYLDRRARLRKLTLTVFEKAGIEREPTDADIDQTQEWLELAEPELIECAAERARGLSLPARSITKRLKEWAAAGIRDVEAARAFKRPGARPGTPAAPGAATARNPALNYEQRNYDDRFFEAYFADVERSRRKDEA